jgi:GNAT superfamily N-acetyltransferase
MFWRLGSREFSARRVPELRADLRALADRQIAPGLAALDGERAVGWVGLGPRGEFDRLTRSRTIPRLDGDAVWSIVCFAVSRAARGRGVGSALLEAATEYAAAHGARVLEAYPVDVRAGGGLAAASAFTGTLAMFERAGFTVESETSSTAGGHPRVVVRRTLATSR